MNSVHINRAPRLLIHPGSWLPVLAFAYSLVFFPGALLYRPTILDGESFSQATELFLLMPKLLFLLCLTLLGFFELRILNPRIQSRSMFWLVGVHLIFVLIGTLNARDEVTFVLLGARGRFDGLLYQCLLCALLAIAYLTLKARPELTLPVQRALVWGASVQAIVVVGQYMGFDPLTLSRRWEPLPIIVGLLAHPGMVAGLLAPCVVIGVILPQSGSKWFWFLPIFLLSLGLSVTNNRSALLAVGIALLGVVLTKRDWSRVAAVALIAVTVFAARLILPHPDSFGRDLKDTTSLETRLMIWPLVFKQVPIIPGSPWIGGGSDAFRLSMIRSTPLSELEKLMALEIAWPGGTVLDHAEVIPGAGEKERDQMLRFNFKSYGTEGAKYVDYEFTLDRAHNLWLDRLLAYGLPSALIWIALFAYPSYYAWCFGSEETRTWTWVLVCLVGYYLTWFPVMQVEPLHAVMIVIAWAGIQYAPSRRSTLETVRATK